MISQQYIYQVAKTEFATDLIMTPGEVVDSGGCILLHGGCKIETGTVWVTPRQAQQAAQYGWKVVQISDNLVSVHRPTPRFYNPAQDRANERKRKRKRKQQEDWNDYRA